MAKRSSKVVGQGELRLARAFGPARVDRGQSAAPTGLCGPRSKNRRNCGTSFEQSTARIARARTDVTRSPCHLVAADSLNEADREGSLRCRGAKKT